MKRTILLLFTVFTAFFAHAIDPITGPSTVCTGATITLSDGTSGGTWSTAVGAAGTIDASGVLTGISAGVVTVTYTVGGPYVTTDVTVNPTPTLTSPTSDINICDSGTFNYTPTSSVSGAAFSWVRPYVTGIAALSGSGSGAISDVLVNTTTFPISIPYTYTVSAGGCSSVATVNVIVMPYARLSNALPVPAQCSSSPFNFVPTSVTLGTTYSWERASVVGVTPATASGSGSISETLVSSIATPVNVVYTYSLTANGCVSKQQLTVTVKQCEDAVPQVANAEVSLKVYPAPSTGLLALRISSPVTENVAVTVTDIAGRVVRKFNIAANSDHQVNLSQEAPGTYMINATTSAGIYHAKVVLCGQ